MKNDNNDLIDFSDEASIEIFNDIENTDEMEELAPIVTSLEKQLSPLIKNSSSIDITKEKLISATRLGLYNMQEKSNVFDNISMDLAFLLKNKIQENGASLNVRTILDGLKILNDMSNDNNSQIREFLDPNPSKDGTSPVNIIFELSNKTESEASSVKDMPFTLEHLSKLKDAADIIAANRKPDIIDIEIESNSEDD